MRIPHLNFPGRHWLRACRVITQAFSGFLGVCLLSSCTNPEHRENSISVRLLAPLKFARFTVRTNLNSAAVATLMREKVKIGSDDPDAYEFLVLPSSPSTTPPNDPLSFLTTGERIHVETVEQYLAALKRGAGSLTTFDITMDGWFRPTAATLKFLSQAKESRHSLLPVKLLEQLPVNIVGYPDSDQERELDEAAAKGITLRDYRRIGKFHRFKATSTSLQFNTEIKSYHLTELARGDFNGDGFEDSLVEVSWRYLEGTGRSVDQLLAERPSTQPLKVTHFPVP